MKWFIKALKQFADFKTRARRKEYWMYNLFYTLFSIITMILDVSLGMDFSIAGISLGYGYIYSLFALATLIPSIALSVRRLHDVSKSGWMLLIIFIPFIGAIWLPPDDIHDRQKVENTWGANPK